MRQSPSRRRPATRGRPASPTRSRTGAAAHRPPTSPSLCRRPAPAPSACSRLPRHQRRPTPTTSTRSNLG
ncbi:hypothetical protein VP06_10920 [Methylobacterium aquaticum]|uniref:Uncharacterized protein n=1 Tax=Methylobacterium aquaticum TaxID=270351 RepID=A0A0J6SRQ1_9HYPH|nr:hypothetical protein VP06_10920 [Methylobacterium aquaticum]